MVAGFEVPEGDPGAIDSALQPLQAVASDLSTQESKVQNGFAHALETWHAPRADAFRSASAGIQVQVTSAHSAVGSSLTVLAAYSKVLKRAQDEIRHLGQLADKRNQQAQPQAASLDPGSMEATQAFQHAGQYVSGLSRRRPSCAHISRRWPPRRPQRSAPAPTPRPRAARS